MNYSSKGPEHVLRLLVIAFRSVASCYVPDVGQCWPMKMNRLFSANFVLRKSAPSQEEFGMIKGREALLWALVFLVILSIANAARIDLQSQRRISCEKLKDANYVFGCSQFYSMCNNVSKYPMQCFDNVVINPAINQCDAIKDVSSCQESSETKLCGSKDTSGRVDGNYENWLTTPTTTTTTIWRPWEEETEERWMRSKENADPAANTATKGAIEFAMFLLCALGMAMSAVKLVELVLEKAPPGNHLPLGVTRALEDGEVPQGNHLLLGVTPALEDGEATLFGAETIVKIATQQGYGYQQQQGHGGDGYGPQQQGYGGEYGGEQGYAKQDNYGPQNYQDEDYGKVTMETATMQTKDMDLSTTTMAMDTPMRLTTARSTDISPWPCPNETKAVATRRAAKATVGSVRRMAMAQTTKMLRTQEAELQARFHTRQYCRYAAAASERSCNFCCRVVARSSKISLNYHYNKSAF
uniref:Chitin-binding type-2 domain-containing protein n=1 Tax=Ditylenchus dipsaci TaxID=166011 RepID=A0A915CZC2_9BILA